MRMPMLTPRAMPDERDDDARRFSCRLGFMMRSVPPCRGGWSASTTRGVGAYEVPLRCVAIQRRDLYIDRSFPFSKTASPRRLTELQWTATRFFTLELWHTCTCAPTKRRLRQAWMRRLLTIYGDALPTRPPIHKSTRRMGPLPPAGVVAANHTTRHWQAAKVESRAQGDRHGSAK